MASVLIVSENPTARGGDRALLVRSGYQVVETCSIYEANDILYENEVDAVLADVGTLGGRLFADVVKRLHPGIPVILLGTFPAASVSGAGTRHDRRAGAADLLGKVATAIGRRRARLDKELPVNGRNA